MTTSTNTLTQEEHNIFINYLKNILIYSVDKYNINISYGTSPTVNNKIYFEYKDQFSLQNHDKFVFLFTFTFTIPDTLFTGNNKFSSVSYIDPLPDFKLIKFPHDKSSFDVKINDLYTQSLVNDSYRKIVQEIIHDYYNPLIKKLIQKRNEMIDHNSFNIEDFVNYISSVA